MTALLASTFLGVATILAGFAALSKRPRRMVLAWLSTGLAVSLFLVVLGFELLGVFNALWVVATSTILHLYSTLYGTRAIADAERSLNSADWVHASGSLVILAATLGFAFSESDFSPTLNTEIGASEFALSFLRNFPELSAAIGFTLFLVIIAAAAVGRPAWINPASKSSSDASNAPSPAGGSS